MGVRSLYHDLFVSAGYRTAACLAINRIHRLNRFPLFILFRRHNKQTAPLPAVTTKTIDAVICRLHCNNPQSIESIPGW